MFRLSLPTIVCLLFSLQTALVATEAAAQVPQPPNPNVADLQDQLENGLKARLPAEFRFIARVVWLVENNRLPISLVQSTFEWARRKKSYKTSLVPYFERALRLRAARRGIRV